MKKNFYFLLLLLLTATCTFAQISFKKVLGLGAEDFEDITATPDSGYIAVGRAGAQLTATNTPGFLVVKMDAAFHIQWSNTYSIAGQAQAHAIKIVRGQGNKYAIVGDLSADSGATVDRFCVFVVDAEGFAIWSKEVSGAGIHNANAISLTKDGNVVVAGLRKEELSSTTSRIYAVCLKSNTGKLLWQKAYNAIGGMQSGKTIERSGANIFIISGNSAFRSINLKINDAGLPLGTASLKARDSLYTQDALLLKDRSLLVAGYTAGPGSTNRKTFVSKFDSTGSVVWARYTTMLSNPHLLEDTNSYVLAGSDTANGSTYTSLVRLDTGGRLLTNALLGNVKPGYSSMSNEIIQTADQGYVIAGELDTLVMNTTAQFAYLTKVSKAFNSCGASTRPVIKFKNYTVTSPSVNTKAVNDTARVSNITLMTKTTARFTNICGDESSVMAYKSPATTLMITKQAGTAVIYPNPVKDVLAVNGLTGTGVKNLSVIDVNGRTIATANTRNGLYKWNVQQLTAGIYYLKILQNDKLVTLKFVKQ